MSQDTPIDPQKSLHAMAKDGPAYAQAKASHSYMVEYRKTIKARCMQAALTAGHTSAAAQEREAYASVEYVDHLAAIGAAEEAAEALRWRLVTAQAALDVWRSQEASNRRMDRGAQ
jgi:flagellar biosynthesis/type III secretory pathway ATPase